MPLQSARRHRQDISRQPPGGRRTLRDALRAGNQLHNDGLAFDHSRTAEPANRSGPTLGRGTGGVLSTVRRDRQEGRRQPAVSRVLQATHHVGHPCPLGAVDQYPLLQRRRPADRRRIDQ